MKSVSFSLIIWLSLFVIPYSGGTEILTALDIAKTAYHMENGEDAKMTMTDLLKDSGMVQSNFDETLSLLMAKGSVAQEFSDGKLHFVLMSRGRQQLTKMTGS